MPLLLLMIFVMPYENSPYLYLATNLLGVFPDFTVIKLLGLAGFAWAAARLAAGDPAARRLAARPARLFLLFFCGVAFVGLVSGTGFAYAISRYLAFLLFLPFVLVSARTHGDLRRVLMALVLSYVLLFPYALRQMLRFDARLGVGVYETNYLATILVLVVPLAFVFAAQQRVRARRRLWTAGGLVLVTMLFLTSSRGGFVGLLVAAMVFVYRRRGPTGALAVMAGLVASIFVLPTDLGTRALATLFQDAGEVPPGLEQSNRAHVALFWAALRMIADNPLLGVGPLNFKTLSTLYTGLEQGNIAHNTFLEVAAEFGLPVFAVFALLLLTVFGCLTRAARLRGSAPADEVAGWAEGLRSGLVGYLVAGLFISAQYEKILWLVVFVTIVLDEVARRHAALAETQEAEGLELAPEPTR